MRINNLLLIILIIISAYPYISKKESNSVAQVKTKQEEKIVISKRSTKDIVAKVVNENPTKHSTTFRNYMDTDGRSTIGVTHNIRVGKEYYISGGITSRTSSYDKQDVGLNLSLTKYW
jgi:uncharacterized protein (UPF0333 family)